MNHDTTPSGGNGPFPLWDPDTEYPAHSSMEDLRIVSHVSVERAQPDGYRYLHESSPAFHGGSLYVTWASHRLFEINVVDELIRYRKSPDGGFTWSPAATWAKAPDGGSQSYNHPVITELNGTLWGFFTRWDQEHCATELFRLAGDDRMESTGTRIPDFVPFRPPERMEDGNWIVSGESTWTEAAVAVSHGDDFSRWDVHVIPRPEGVLLKYPETTLMQSAGRIVAICRPKTDGPALTSTSSDFGRSWTELQQSNMEVHSSQPFCGRLSTSQHYLISNSPAPDRRSLLSIAVTDPGGDRFRHVWKIRHQAYPVVRLFGGYAVEGRTPESLAGQKTEWSYPGAVEHDGKLYVTYTQGKEDCNLSIIPLEALRVEQGDPLADAQERSRE